MKVPSRQRSGSFQRLPSSNYSKALTPSGVIPISDQATAPGREMSGTNTGLPVANTGQELWLDWRAAHLEPKRIKSFWRSAAPLRLLSKWQRVLRKSEVTKS